MDGDDASVDEDAKKRAMPSFEPNHVFNCDRVYRDMAKYSMRLGAYDAAKDKLDLAVSLSKNQDNMAESLFLRSQCSQRLLDISSALSDCNKALQIKDNPRGQFQKGLLLFKQNRFEDALSTFARHSRLKSYPDQFDYGVSMVTGMMQNCIGKNAGPLGKYILNLKIRNEKQVNNENQKIYADRMQRKVKAFSDKYLGLLAEDKRAIADILQSPPLIGDNEAIDVATRLIERNTVEKLDFLENSLWQRKPLYCYRHLRIKPSEQRQRDLKVERKLRKKLVLGELDRQMEKLRKYNKKGESIEVYKLSEYLKKKVWVTPKEMLPCKNDYMARMIDIVGDMYLKLKAFKKKWKTDWNDQRLIVMIGLDRPKTTVYDLCKEAFHAPIIDIRTKIEEFAEYFQLSDDEYQKLYYNFEIACLFSMVGMWREARSFSKTSIFDARKQANPVWYINSLFVYARSEVQDGSYVDAMVTFIAIREACRKFGFVEQEEFFSRALALIHLEPSARRIPQMQKSIRLREEQIIRIMPNFDLKNQAKSLFISMNQKPSWRRMMLMKGTSVPISEVVEEADIVTEALEERERAKDERIAMKKARAQAAAATEKTRDQSMIPPIEGVDNYNMRKLIDRYRKSSFNLDNFQT